MLASNDSDQLVQTGRLLASPSQEMCESSGLELKHKQPWASFCIATYRRPALLGKTLRAIAEQTFPDFEVIVSDNDPEGSASAVVQELDDPRFRYVRNHENIGMIKNFRAAVSHARGKFIAMISDDDPPYPNMLSVLQELAQKFPEYGAYFGPADFVAEDKATATAFGFRLGRTTWLADAPLGQVRLFERNQLPIALFSYQFFPCYFTGIVRRDTALSIGGYPDYGTSQFSDFAYVALAGSRQGCATVNIPLGYQVNHGQNIGFRYFSELRSGLEQFYRFMVAEFAGQECWSAMRPRLERYLGTYAGHCIASHERYLKLTNRNESRTRSFLETKESVLSLPYLRGARLAYWLSAHLWFLWPLDRLRSWGRRIVSWLS